MLELIEIFFFGSNDPNLNQAFLPALMVAGGVAKGLMGYDWGGKRRKALSDSREAYDRQANTLDALRSAAGSSGIAGLAQAMSNQAMNQAQKTAASIGKQEAKNKLLAAQQASKIDQLERMGADKTQQLIAKGQLSSMQMEQSKQGTLLGMDAQSVQGAQAAVQAGNQMMMSGVSDIMGGVGQAYTPGVGGAKGTYDFF